MFDQSTLNQLRSIVGPTNVLTDPSSLDIFSSDALSPDRAYGIEQELLTLPSAIVFPETTQHTSQILKTCFFNEISVIPAGSGTGVMGGITPPADSIILSMANMNNFIALDAIGHSTTVEAGILLGTLNDQLNKESFMIGHDPYSLNLASVGGAISTNGVGYTASRYGTMGDQVLALEIVLPDGTILPLRHTHTPSVGPDISKFFIGSEGTLGVITKATIKVFPKPQSTHFITLQFSDFQTGYDFFIKAYNSEFRPSLFELNEVDEQSNMHLMYEGDATFTTAASNWVRNHMGPSTNIKSSNITREYWVTRHNSAVQYAQTALHKKRKIKWSRNTNRLFEYLHISLPPSQVVHYKHVSTDIIQSHGLNVEEYCIWGKPDFFSMMLVPKNTSSASAKSDLTEAARALILLSCEMGGSIEYCHGIGIKLRDLLPNELGNSYDFLKTIKNNLDPKRIMNPNKYV